MDTHVPSNFSTYQTIAGKPVYATFFVLLNETPMAFISADLRRKVIEAAAKRGEDCRAISHKDAFEMLRGGRVAFLYEDGEPWQQLKIADAYRLRLTVVENAGEFEANLIRFVFKS